MKIALTLLTPLLTSWLLQACSAEQRTFENDEPFVVVDFRDSFGTSRVDVVGVTIEPDTGQRYLLESSRGIFEVDADGNMSLVRAIKDFPVPNEALQSAFTDIASLGHQRFALTARNEGYILDLDANTLLRHFCYLPTDQPDVPIEEVYQLTQSVAYDPARHRIYAQPQTRALNSNKVRASALGIFGEENGAKQTWIRFDTPKYIAGAIAMAGDNDLLMAKGATLTRYDFRSLVQEVSLSEYEVHEVSGMAVDMEARTILIADAARDALLELPLSVIELTPAPVLAPDQTEPDDSNDADGGISVGPARI